MPLTNPFRKFRCPYCDQEFFLNESAIISNRTGNVLRPPTPAASIFTRSWVEPLDGTVYAAEDARHECPHCKRMLPYRFEVSKQVNLAIVGDSGAGKSHYITALIEQIRNGGMVQQGDVIINFSWLDEKSAQRFQHYYDIIFRDKTEFQPTPPTAEPAGNAPIIIEPLMFQLTIRTSYQQRVVPVVNVTIYDVGGEDIVDPIRLTRFGRHIPRAQAIIYVADPGTMPNVIIQLPPALQPPQSYSSVLPRRSYSALESVMPIFERWNELKPGERITTPIAIMVSKSDLLSYAISVQEQAQYRFFYDPVYYGRVNLEDVQAVDIQTRTLLAKLGERRLLDDSARFKNVSFFTCSAIGESADSQGKYRQVTPHRCLDPFMWILWQLGSLESFR